MKKRKKRLPAMLLALAAGVFICGCGGVKESPYAGIYNSMKIEADGYAVTGEAAAGASIMLDHNGTGTITLSGEVQEMKWSEQEGRITVKLQDNTEYQGNLTENTIFFEEFQDRGVQVTFGKEGTEAAKVSFYFSDGEKAMLGTWKSISVTDVFGVDAAEETDPKGMELVVKDDKTVTITRNGESLGSFTWEYYEGNCFLETDLSWEMVDGQMVVDYYPKDDWYTYICEKNLEAGGITNE